jgi:hypothetical protein
VLPGLPVAEYVGDALADLVFECSVHRDAELSFQLVAPSHEYVDRVLDGRGCRDDAQRSQEVGIELG